MKPRKTPTELANAKRERSAKWRAEHPTEARESRRKHYQKNRAEILAKSAEKRRENLAQIRQRDVERKRQVYWRRRKELLDLLGGQCQRCGFDDWRALQVDHVNGGGTQERTNALRGVGELLKDIKQHGSRKYQLLCANCHQIKQFEINRIRRETPD